MSTDVGVQVSSLAPKKNTHPFGWVFFFGAREWRLESVSEHAIGHVRPPVQKLVDTLISFSRPPQAKKKCKQVSSLAPLRNGPGKIEQAQARVSRERKRNANKSPLSQKDENPSLLSTQVLESVFESLQCLFSVCNLHAGVIQ